MSAPTRKKTHSRSSTSSTTEPRTIASAQRVRAARRRAAPARRRSRSTREPGAAARHSLKFQSARQARPAPTSSSQVKRSGARRPRPRPTSLARVRRGATPRSNQGDTPIRKGLVGASGFARGGVTIGGPTTGGEGDADSTDGSSTGSTSSDTPKASAKIKFEHVDEGRWGGGGNSIDQVTAPSASCSSAVPSYPAPRRWRLTAKRTDGEGTAAKRSRATLAPTASRKACSPGQCCAPGPRSYSRRTVRGGGDGARGGDGGSAARAAVGAQKSKNVARIGTVRIA